MSELRKIPNVGPQTERDLIAMGYTTIESLKGKSAEELYSEECRLRGCIMDRCQLYLYRAVEYFVNTPKPNLHKCSWWLWKDDFAMPSPCGALCVRCDMFPTKCSGCRNIRGKVHWLKYTGDKICKVYDCCVNRKGMDNCGECTLLPCERFTKDPTLSDEENVTNLRQMIERLKSTDKKKITDKSCKP